MVPNVTKDFFIRTNKCKKCKKCEYLLEKTINNEIIYYLCAFRTKKLFTGNWSIKSCKYYKKKEKIKNV